ncbi:hypothetical protein [Kitasatospora sp. NBC_01539]|uniref:hypothetical protein n=1 Tax=Kitasatospora sp. NBC_01539 TaxID=2903577 RepID=UPI0038602EFD
MAICTGCGAASAGWARSCANCGRSFDRPGEPVSAGLIGAVEVEAEAGSGAASAAGRWGRGVPYEPRGGGPAAFGRALAPWAPAARALLAPTVLLLVAAALLAQPGGGFPAGDYGSRLRVCMARVLAAFGAATETRSAGDSDGTLGLNSQVTSGGMLLLTVLWTVLLWLGLRAARRRGPRADARTALAEAGRTGVLAGVVVVLLGLAGRVRVPAFPDFPGRGSYLVEPSLWPTVPVAVLLAGATALAVHGRAADPPRVAPWRAPARAAAAAAVTSVALAGAAVVVLAALRDDGPTLWAVVPMAFDGGLFLLAFGSGAQIRVENWGTDTGPEAFSLLHPGAVSWAWWTVPAAVVAALVLAGWACRLRPDPRARVRLAVLHTVLLSALMVVAGLSDRYSLGLEPTRRGVAWSLGVVGVLVANAVWSAVGALVLPAVFGRVGPARVRIGAPPAGGAEPSVEPVAAPEPPTVPFGSEVMDWRTRA